VFASLKRVPAGETEKASRLDPGHSQCAEWATIYYHAREKAFTSTNIESGWKATGLMPLSPITVLAKIQAAPPAQALSPSTPRQTNSFDLPLFHTSPLHGTELRRANAGASSSNCMQQPSAMKHAPLTFLLPPFVCLDPRYHRCLPSIHRIQASDAMHSEYAMRFTGFDPQQILLP